jgi:methionyl-tRNA formyltransferase
VFSLLESSFATVRDWAEAAGHEIAILVTQPGTESTPGLRYSTVASRDTVVMVVPTVAACEAALADLEVDLGIVFTFGWLPESVATLPRRGTVNLHPALLPAYRGANGYRALYEGEPRIGATLHYLTPEFDEGAILAQVSDATPADVDPASARETLQRAATAVLEAGVPRALAGERGEDQNASAATRAARFTEPEAVLDLAVTTHLFQCRVSALMLAGIQPWLTLDGERQPLRAARHLHGLTADTTGVISHSTRRAIVAVTDGVLELELGKLPF